MNDTTITTPSTGGWRLQDTLLSLAVVLFGIVVAVSLHWPALTHAGIYKSDVKQSPHWAAYHTTSFQPDDPLLAYASFNESPLQNAIYWTGTRFFESIALGKLLAVVSFGLLALVFFLVGRAMYGVRFGLLLAWFITMLPDHFEYSAGFFSKFWMTPLLLICVFLLQTDRPRWLVGLLPFGALAYPVSAVLVGMTSAIHWLRELYRKSDRARPLFVFLAIGSVLAVGLLLAKYASPPEGIGPMRPGAELRQMEEVREGGYPSKYIPVPRLDVELLRRLAHPSVLMGAILYFMILGRREIAWERSWTSLILASMVGYLLADLLFLKLYIPNRYTRHSMAVLIALWNARNWDLILARLQRPALRRGLVAALLAVGLGTHVLARNDESGWSDYRPLSPMLTFVRTALPEGILIAGPPRALDNVMVEGKRSVLVPYKLAHPWFVDHYDRMRERTRATLRAHFAAGPEPLNELHRTYGVTHFLVDKNLLERALDGKRVFTRPYNAEVYEALGERREFYLSPGPREFYVWEDERYAILPLPTPSPEPDSRTADRSP